jgi:DNA-binding transcriptional ArsR family regulator
MTTREPPEAVVATGGRDPPPEASTVFELLSDETRVRIVSELSAAAGSLRFSTLCDRVGVQDTGRFNYHLERLRGSLVAKGEEGYVLTETGLTYAELLGPAR